jgi:hypothetical protein
MRHIQTSSLVVTLLFAFACASSACTPTVDGSFDILASELDTEYTAYQSLQNAVAYYNPTIPDFQNLHWDESNTAFVEWQRALDDLAEQIPQVQSAWEAATEQDRTNKQARYDEAKNRLTQLLTRGVYLKVVLEPWTRYLMTTSKAKWEQASSDLASATNAFFGTAIATPGWIVDFMDDRYPISNAPIGPRRWSVISDTFCEGSGALARCPLNDKSPVALRVTDFMDSVAYLHKSTQTSSLNLGWTSTPERAVWFERQPGKTGPLTYNESVALHVKDVGYIKYEHHTLGVSLSSSDTPVYEWQIVPQWSQMSGQWVDTQLSFGVQNLTRPGYLGDCNQTLGANVGWITNVDDNSMNNYACE